MNFISEPNLYKLIFQSRKPEAEKFADWVMYEVLPAIVYKGVYMTTKRHTTSHMIDRGNLSRLTSTIRRPAKAKRYSNR